MSTTMGARAGSALIGAPPNNQDDFYIVRGWYRSYGLYSANSSAGFLYAAKNPNDGPPESKQVAVIASMVIVILAIVIPTVARVIVRLRENQTRFGSDDWAIIAATCLAIVYPCLQISTVVNNGAGRHTWENTYADYNQYAYNLGLCQVIFYVAVGLIKISITLFVRRLADRASRAWRIFTDVFLGTLILYIGMAIFCKLNWDAMSPDPARGIVTKSIDRVGFLMFASSSSLGQMIKVLSVMHAIQGIVLLGSPIVILWHIRIDMAKKTRLFVIWLVGGISVVGGLLQQTAVTITNDNFWEYTSILRWTALDLALGVLVASLPVLDSAIMGTFSSVKTKLGGSHSNSRGRSNNWTDRDDGNAPAHNPRDYSESIDNMINSHKDDGIELNIIRTDEVHLTYDHIDSANTSGDHKKDRVHVKFEL